MSEKRKVLLGPRETVTGDRERDSLICAARAIEWREGERLGWDQLPKVWTWHLADIDSGAVDVRPVPQRLWRAGYANPADDIIAAALAIQPDRDAPVLKFADSRDGIAAVAMMTEAWAADPSLLTAEERARHNSGTRTLAGSPHRFEIRTLVAVDINGNGYTLVRVRDREGEPHLTLVDRDRMWADEGEGPGRLVRALYCLAYGARIGTWPKGASS